LISDGSSVTVEESFSLLSEKVSANNVVSSIISFNAAPCKISVTSSTTSVVPSVDTLAASSAALATSSATLVAASAASFSRMALGLHGCF
jgi:hypothetical protein